jgi:serine phosphatase RsbU (regulator of sigma subunit)
LSEHLLATPEPAAIARTTLQEVGQLIRITAAWVLLLDGETEELVSIAAAGPSLTLKDNVGTNNFVAASLARNEAEICNDMPGSQIFKDPHSRRISLLCAPLKTEQRVLGVILLMGEPPINFTARDLKLLNTVALQAGPAIEMARLYQIAHVQGRMERELQMAYEVQASLIPAESPSIPEEGWEFAGRWRPARELSGDYYDFIPLGQGTYGLVIADVADKGMPSALFMVNTRSALRTAVDQANSPAAAISGANRLVSQEATDGLFVTLIYGQLNSRSGSLTYVNAGHNPALHYHANNGTLTNLPRTGMPLGILPGANYTQQDIQIQSGDTIILYTDGVTEAMNLVNEEFGMERLRAVIFDHYSDSAEAMATAIETAVNQFTNSAPPFDDFTLMIIRRQSH